MSFIVRWEAHEATELERKTFAQGMQSMRQGWSRTFEQFAGCPAKP